MVEFRHLETFVWVARLGGFHSAARKLHATQPAISARIAALESELGARLLDRGARRVVLTARGAALLEHAERMLAQRAEMLRLVGDPASFRGVLRLGVPETVVHTWFSVLVERINRAFPSVTLDVEVDSTPSLREALLSENLDLAILMAPVAEQSLRCEPLCSYPLAWLCSAELPLPKARTTLAQLAQWPIITHRRGSPPYESLRRALHDAGLTEARIFGSSSIAAILRMTRDGIGPSVLPLAIVRQELRQQQKLRQFRVALALPPIGFMVCHRQNPDSYLAAAVAEIALDAARRQGVKHFR